jgi:quercetin dioxygenase-like cupin family protein
VALCVGATSAPAFEAKAPLKVRPLLTTTKTWEGAPIVYPQGQPEISGLIIELAPGAETGWHSHPVPSFAFILEGTLEVQLKDGRSKRLQAGEALVEVIGPPQRHGDLRYPRKTGRVLRRSSGAKSYCADCFVALTRKGWLSLLSQRSPSPPLSRWSRSSRFHVNATTQVALIPIAHHAARAIAGRFVLAPLSVSGGRRQYMSRDRTAAIAGIASVGSGSSTAARGRGRSLSVAQFEAI